MTKQLEALIAKIKKQTESFDTVMLKEDEAHALIAALEQAQPVPQPFGFVTKRCAEHMHDNDHDENNWMWSISAVVIGCDPKLKHEVPVYLYPSASIPSAGGQVEGK